MGAVTMLMPSPRCAIIVPRPHRGKELVMPRNVPIRNLKDTSGFLAFVLEDAEPVMVTKNGEEAFVAMRPAAYEKMRLRGVRAELLEMLIQDDEDIANGNYVDGDTFFAEMDELIKKTEVLIEAEAGSVETSAL